MRILLTGCAGFIGSHTTERLLAEGHSVVGVDNFDPFYDRSIKETNLAPAKEHPAFRFHEMDIGECGPREWDTTIGDEPIDAVIHLAAKAGVRPSIQDPAGYLQANVVGTQNLLEWARDRKIEQFVFASSSSVYGVNREIPWREDATVLKPISPYASTKVSAELLGHVYSHLYDIRFLALRFFTVYGPRQRPDLAIHKFTAKILRGESIPVFGDGSTRRDYTFVSDTVDGIIAALHYRNSTFERINLGNNKTVSLAEMIATVEEVVGKKAILERLPDQPGDVPQTWADLSKAKALLNYSPKVTLREGVKHFLDWYTTSANLPRG